MRQHYDVFNSKLQSTYNNFPGMMNIYEKSGLAQRELIFIKYETKI